MKGNLCGYDVLGFGGVGVHARVQGYATIDGTKNKGPYDDGAHNAPFGGQRRILNAPAHNEVSHT